MSRTLLERPTSTPDPEVGQAPKRRGALLLAGTLGAVLVVAAPWAAGKALEGLTPEVESPLEARIVDQTGPALLLALEDVGEYHGARGTFQVVVDLEKDTPYVPSAISGERTTYLATGTVDGYVDLSNLGADAIESDPEQGTVTIVLPPARLGEPNVDAAESRVVARERGLLDRVGGVFVDTPTSERLVAEVAGEKLEAAAAESDLPKRTEESTEAMLTALARGLGYEKVTVEFENDPRT